MAIQSFFILLLLSHVAHFCASKYINTSDAIPLRENPRSNLDTFILVNPKQVHRLETTISRFLSNLAIPINNKIILRSTSPGAKDLQQTIREICEGIRKKITQFAGEFDLGGALRQFGGSSDNISLSSDWFSEMLLQNAFTITDFGNIVNEVGSIIDHYFGEGNATPKRNKGLTSEPSGFKFLGVVHDAADFSGKLTQCLMQLDNARTRQSILTRGILDLARRSPGKIVRVLRSSARNMSNDSAPMNRAWQKPWYVFVCLSMMSNGDVTYEECTRDVRYLHDCLRSVRTRARNEIRNADVKLWTRAIRRASECQARSDGHGDATVFCKSSTTMLWDTKRKIRYILESALGEKVSGVSPLHRAAGNLANTLSRRPWGRKFVEELYQHVRIFEDGKLKLLRLSRIRERDERAAARHAEISKALRVYKRGVVLRTFDAIKKIHRSASDFEEFFAKGVKDISKNAFKSYVNILSSMMDWMSNLLELYAGDNGDKEAQDLSNDGENSVFEDAKGFRIVPRSKSDVMKDVDDSMSGLMKSMNHIGRYKRSYNMSTLTCIANNLLLATILMQTTAFISSLSCLTGNGSDQSLDQSEDNWTRERRSLPSSQENSDFVASDYLFIQIQANTTTIF